MQGMRRYQLLPPVGGLPAIIDEIAYAAGQAIDGAEPHARRVAETVFAGRVRQSNRCGCLVECGALGAPVLAVDATPLVSTRPMLLLDLDAADLPRLYAAVVVDELGGADRTVRELTLARIFTEVVGPFLFESPTCGRAPGCRDATPTNPFDS